MNYQIVNAYISTNDETVKTKLRELGEPICYFGEDQFERRERLSRLISTKETNISDDSNNVQEIHREYFFSQGDCSLVNFRRQILLFSIPKSYFRLRNARERSRRTELIEKEIHHMVSVVNSVDQVICEMCNSRHITGCRISPLQKKVSTFGFGPDIKIWNVCDFSVEKLIKTKGYITNDFCWLLTEEGEGFLTCDSNADIVLWGSDHQEKSKFIGHEDQVNKLVIHPLRKYLFSASSDETWRVWDVEMNNIIQVQEGHSRPIFSLDIHPDGALVVTGDTGGVFRLWDIRSGRSILHNLSHTKKIITTRFSPNCDATFLTSSEDNSIKIWDVRRMESPLRESLLGHSKLISDVMYEPNNGLYIISASLDGTLKFWSKFTDGDQIHITSQGSKYSCIRSINTHSHKITGLDIFDNGEDILTVGLDHTLRFWSYKNSGKDPENDHKE